MPQDPRSHNRYRTLRTRWLASYTSGHGTCILCHSLVDTRLPGTHRYGPTIEHLVPIRWIIANTRDDRQALDLACDTSHWALAHNVCQARQGGASTVERTPKSTGMAGASRVW